MQNIKTSRLSHRCSCPNKWPRAEDRRVKRLGIEKRPFKFQCVKRVPRVTLPTRSARVVEAVTEFGNVGFQKSEPYLSCGNFRSVVGLTALDQQGHSDQCPECSCYIVQEVPFPL